MMEEKYNFLFYTYRSPTSENVQKSSHILYEIILRRGLYLYVHIFKVLIGIIENIRDISLTSSSL